MVVRAVFPAVLPVSALLLAGLAALPAGAQAHACGDLQLVFLNPDLQPQADGFIHAQGQFFAQFQAIGAGADRIKVFGFSFSPVGQGTDEQACGAPVWVTGAYLQNYRADYDPADGFFIPVVTPLVPDGSYNAAVHAYDADNNELARFWSLAVVDNCDGDVGAKCDGDPAQLQGHDRTQPWMIVLPGDGQALEGHRLTVEFGEALRGHAVFLNGRNITAELAEWEGRLWDADYTPDYAPGAGQLPHCQAPAPAQDCVKYGPAYEWKGRELVADDVVRVEATDLAGNRAVKSIHVGSGVTGGAIVADVPALENTVDRQQADAPPGGSATFGFDIRNRGAGTGHPFADATVPDGWGFEWQPVHVVVGPGETRHQELVVTVPKGAAGGVYPVNATLTYKKGGDEVVLAQPLTVLVGAGSANAGDDLTDLQETSKASFALPLPAVFALLGLAAVRLRRRGD